MADAPPHHPVEPNHTIRVTIRCFSRIRDVLDAPELTLDLPAGTAAGEAATRVIAMGAGRLDGLPFRIALNQEFAAETDILSDGDELALIPPVQGG